MLFLLFGERSFSMREQHRAILLYDAHKEKLGVERGGRRCAERLGNGHGEA